MSFFKKTSTLVGFAFVVIIGLLWLQVAWMKEMFQLSEKNTNAKITGILEETLFNFDQKVSIPILFTDPTNLSQPLIGREKEITSEIVRKIIDSSFYSHGIFEKYGFVIQACRKKYILLYSDDESKEAFQSRERSYTNNDINNYIDVKIHSSNKTIENKHIYHLEIFFHNKHHFLLNHTLGWQLACAITLFVLLLLIVVYLLYSFNKQKKIASLKNDFINTLTHEFKTPIASIQLAARLIDEDSLLSDKSKKYQRLLTSESHRLESQVSNILQMSMIDAGNYIPDKRIINIHSLLKKILEKMSLLVEQAGGIIYFKPGASFYTIEAEEMHISNVFFNLIDNAIKYSTNSPRITIETSDDKKNLSISITDNGIGIDMKYQKQIFDRFFRIRDKSIPISTGFGIGLSYVKAIIESHSGTVAIKSELTKGTTIIINLPLLQNHEEIITS